MAAGLVMLGVIAGLCSAAAALAAGAGIGMALLVYAAGGMLGIGLGVAAMLLPATARVLRRAEA